MTWIKLPVVAVALAAAGCGFFLGYGTPVIAVIAVSTETLAVHHDTHVDDAHSLHHEDHVDPEPVEIYTTIGSHTVMSDAHLQKKLFTVDSSDTYTPFQNVR